MYRITKTLDTRKSIVLRGAGKDLTTLFFPKSLTEVYGNTWSEVRGEWVVVVVAVGGCSRHQLVSEVCQASISRSLALSFAASAHLNSNTGVAVLCFSTQKSYTHSPTYV